MIYQNTFTYEYAMELHRRVKSGQDMYKYGMDTFEYDKSQVRFMPSIKFPEKLLEKLKPEPAHDFESAIAVYEAYPLTPLQATDVAFWIYLAHVDYFPYMRERYPKVQDAGFNDPGYIRLHWFTEDRWKFLYTFGALWWIVQQTVDPANAADKYKYARWMFKDADYRISFGRYPIGRHKPAVFGFFDFLEDNCEITAHNLQARIRFMSKHLNKIGGTRLLSSQPKEFFYEELTKIKPQIMEI